MAPGIKGPLLTPDHLQADAVADEAARRLHGGLFFFEQRFSEAASAVLVGLEPALVGLRLAGQTLLQQPRPLFEQPRLFLIGVEAR